MYRLTVASPTRRTTNRPWKGRGYVTWHVLNFGYPIHISAMAEARALKLCTKGDYIKSGQRDDKSPLKGAWFCSRDPFLPREAMLSAVFAVDMCLCVCVSVTLRYCIKTAKRTITQTTPHDSPMILVFWCQRSWRNSNGITPYGGDKCRWGGLELVTFDEKRAITRKRYKMDI